MPRYINADALLLKVQVESTEAMAENLSNAGYVAFCSVVRRIVEKSIGEMPTADVQEVKHGKWMKYSVDIAEHPLHCSLCGWSNYRISNREVIDFGFCPRCGQAIDWEGRDNESIHEST